MLSRRRPWMLLLACCCAAPLAWLAAAQDVAPAAKEIQWRTDFNQARAESEKSGLPIVIDFTMKPCFFCDKMDATTFRDPRVALLMNQQFIPLKILDKLDRDLCDKMRIESFPTLVIAAPGGKILHMKAGYVEPDSFYELLQRNLTQVTTPDWMKTRFDQAQKAYQEGDYHRAFAALREILEDSKGRSVHAAAKTLLAEIETKANEKVTKAKELANLGKSSEAVQALTETLLTFPGLPAAREAGELLTKLTQQTQEKSKQKERRASELIAQAREFYKNKDIIPCLDRCEILLASYGDLPQGLEASQLIQEIRGNQEWLQLAADTLADRLASVYLALADNMSKRNRPREAEAVLRRVVQAFPGTRYAESAQIRIGQLQGIPANRVDVTGGP